jgi:hypothetical protein
MRGNVQVSRRPCPQCGREVKAERNSTVWGCGDLVLVLVTLGLWVPIRWALGTGSNPWRCAECGTRL